MLLAVLVSLITTMPTMAMAATTTSAVTTTHEAISPRSSPTDRAHAGFATRARRKLTKVEAVSHTSLGVFDGLHLMSFRLVGVGG